MQQNLFPSVLSAGVQREFGATPRGTTAYRRVTEFERDVLMCFPFGNSYAINMGIRPMKWDNWIELDSE